MRYGDAGASPLPREIAPGVFWLGTCTVFPYEGRMLHAYASVFVIAGEEHSIVIEAGQTKDQLVLERQLDELMSRGIPEPKYLFVSHNEVPHSGGIGRFLARFPEAIACGEVTDLHLVFPEYVDRLQVLDPGDRLPLGGRDFVVVEAVFRDLAYTRWGYDTGSKVLFASDGFSYSHFHDEDQCGCLAEEVEELDLPDQTALFAMAAFYWTQFVDVEPYIKRLEELVFEELDVELIAPTHGLPFADLRTTMPLVTEGLRAGSHMIAGGSIVEET
jgi:flavorubredoxin